MEKPIRQLEDVRFLKTNSIQSEKLRYSHDPFFPHFYDDCRQATPSILRSRQELIKAGKNSPSMKQEEINDQLKQGLFRQQENLIGSRLPPSLDSFFRNRSRKRSHSSDDTQNNFCSSLSNISQLASSTLFEEEETILNQTINSSQGHTQNSQGIRTLTELKWNPKNSQVCHQSLRDKLGNDSRLSNSKFQQFQFQRTNINNSSSNSEFMSKRNQIKGIFSLIQNKNSFNKNIFSRTRTCSLDYGNKYQIPSTRYQEQIKNTGMDRLVKKTQISLPINQRFNFDQNTQIKIIRTLKVNQIMLPKEEISPINRNIQEKVSKQLEQKVEKQPDSFGSKIYSDAANLHFIEIYEELTEDQLQDRSLSTYHQGIKLIKLGKDREGIRLFHQSLNLNKLNFNVIYDLASIYERKNQVNTSFAWLEIASLFEQNSTEIKFAYALLFYRKNSFINSYRTITNLIDSIIIENPKRKVPMTFTYLKCLCGKTLGTKMMNSQEKNEIGQISPLPEIKISDKLKQRSKVDINQDIQSQLIEESEIIYLDQSKRTCPKDYKLLRNLMFAIVFRRLRKKEIEFPPFIFCEFVSVITRILNAEDYFPCLEPIIKDEQRLIQNHQAPPTQLNIQDADLKHSRKIAKQLQPLSFQNNKGLNLSKISRRKHEIIQALHQIGFFCRFSCDQLSQFFNQFEINYIQSGKLIIPKEGEVLIITGGYLSLFDHSENYNQPNIIAQYSCGSILGCTEIDNQISKNPNIWFVSTSHVEVISVQKDNFLNIWKQQSNPQGNQILCFIKKIDIFQQVSEQTLFELAFELLEERQYFKEDILFNDGEFVNKFENVQLSKTNPKLIKNLKNRINNKINTIQLSRQVIDGFFIVKEGNFELVSYKNWNPHFLGPYNYIGENLIFQTLSISRFGMMKCYSQSAKCFFLSRSNFYRVLLLDKQIMKSSLHQTNYYKSCQKMLYKYFKQYNIENIEDSHS